MMKKTLVISILLAFAHSPAQAGPSGGKITQGSGTISDQGQRHQIDQRSQRLVAEYDRIRLNSGESLTVHQPSASAAALLRDRYPGSINIDGNVSANGHLYFIDPDGLRVGSGARISTGGFHFGAQMDDQQFMTGHGILQPGNAKVRIYGEISAPEVEISAQQIRIDGSVKGNNVTLSTTGISASGDPLISVKAADGGIRVEGNLSGRLFRVVSPEGRIRFLRVKVRAEKLQLSGETVDIDRTQINSQKFTAKAAKRLYFDESKLETNRASLKSEGSMSLENAKITADRVAINSGRNVDIEGTTISANQASIRAHRGLDIDDSTVQVKGSARLNAGRDIEIKSSGLQAGSLRVSAGDDAEISHAWLSAGRMEIHANDRVRMDNLHMEVSGDLKVRGDRIETRGVVARVGGRSRWYGEQKKRRTSIVEHARGVRISAVRNVPVPNPVQIPVVVAPAPEIMGGFKTVPSQKNTSEDSSRRIANDAQVKVIINKPTSGENPSDESGVARVVNGVWDFVIGAVEEITTGTVEGLASLANSGVHAVQEANLKAASTVFGVDPENVQETAIAHSFGRAFVEANELRDKTEQWAANKLGYDPESSAATAGRASSLMVGIGKVKVVTGASRLSSELKTTKSVAEFSIPKAKYLVNQNSGKTWGRMVQVQPSTASKAVREEQHIMQTNAFAADPIANNGLHITLNPKGTGGSLRSYYDSAGKWLGETWGFRGKQPKKGLKTIMIRQDRN